MENIDNYRKAHLAVAEAIDAWRIIPRAIVAGYSYMLWKAVNWYMNLTPHMIDGCKMKDMTNCIADAPTTQHAVLITTIVGIAAAVFGLYATSGKKWNGFTEWNSQSGGKETSEG